MKVISLGAGVQSSTLLLMSCIGEIEKADCAIFADTGCEPQGVYAHLDWLEEQASAYGIPVHRVSAGSLEDDVYAHLDGQKDRVASIPFFLKGPDSDLEGMSRRQCTNDYKIAPIRRKIRTLMDKGEEVEMWIGISTDEIQRMKDSNVKYITHRWPLIEKRMSRSDCLEWYRGKGFRQPAKSACVFCPYRKNPEWQRMKEDEPEAFASAVEFDKRIRKMPKINHECFLHRSLKPLDEIDFNEAEGQFDFGFDNECEGMCGL